VTENRKLAKNITNRRTPPPLWRPATVAGAHITPTSSDGPSESTTLDLVLGDPSMQGGTTTLYDVPFLANYRPEQGETVMVLFDHGLPLALGPTKANRVTSIYPPKAYVIPEAAPVWELTAKQEYGWPPTMMVGDTSEPFLIEDNSEATALRIDGWFSGQTPDSPFTIEIWKGPDGAEKTSWQSFTITPQASSVEQTIPFSAPMNYMDSVEFRLTDKGPAQIIQQLEVTLVAKSEWPMLSRYVGFSSSGTMWRIRADHAIRVEENGRWSWTTPGSESTNIMGLPCIGTVVSADQYGGSAPSIRLKGMPAPLRIDMYVRREGTPYIMATFFQNNYGDTADKFISYPYDSFYLYPGESIFFRLTLWDDEHFTADWQDDQGQWTSALTYPTFSLEMDIWLWEPQPFEPGQDDVDAEGRKWLYFPSSEEWVRSNNGA
jgi:hypothetical protein